MHITNRVNFENCFSKIYKHMRLINEVYGIQICISQNPWRVSFLNPQSNI